MERGGGVELVGLFTPFILRPFLLIIIGTFRQHFIDIFIHTLQLKYICVFVCVRSKISITAVIYGLEIDKFNETSTIMFLGSAAITKSNFVTLVNTSIF